MRGGDEDVLLFVVGGAFGVVRIAEVVHRVDERLVVHLQFVQNRFEDVGGDRVETEVHVEEVKVMVVVGYPAGFEHQGWPPSAGDRAAVGRNGIG